MTFSSHLLFDVQSSTDEWLSASLLASCFVISHPLVLHVLLTADLFICPILKVLKGHDDHVITCLQFCGNRIVSGSDDNTLKVWSAITGKVWVTCFSISCFPP